MLWFVSIGLALLLALCGVPLFWVLVVAFIPLYILASGIILMGMAVGIAWVMDRITLTPEQRASAKAHREVVKSLKRLQEGLKRN